MSNTAFEIVRAVPQQLGSSASSDFNTCPFRNLITPPEVKSIVNRALNCEADVLNFSLQSYSCGKLGYLGSHKRLYVDVRANGEKKTLYFFVKAVPYDIPPQAEYVTNKGVFEQEVTFYREIVPQLCEGHSGEPWLATCFMAKKDALVFEDLNLKGYYTTNRIFDKELVAAGLSALARMHASSLLAEARLGTSLKEIYPHAFEEKAFSHSGQTRQWFDAGIKVSVAIAQQLGLDSSLLPAACEEVFNAVGSSPTKTNVVSHGDLWGNNLMFNNDAPPNCLLVDFQLLRYSPLAHDVAQFLYLCTNRAFREVWEETMLKHYYSVLRKTLSSSRISVKIPPWSELVEGMEEQRLAAVITALMYFPTVLMDKELSAHIMNDPVTYAEYSFRNRNDAVLENMKKDKEYGERISEIVAELIELSSRLDELPKPS